MSSNKAFSLLDVILVLVIIGIMGYFAIQSYFKWAESLNGSEAINQLKKIKNEIELCALTKNTKSSIDACIVNTYVQNADTMHFKCCIPENNSKKDKQIAYSIHALRNEHELMVYDIGGNQASCLPDSKPIPRFQSGVGLCRNLDGTMTIQGWGIYTGIYN